MKDKEKALQCEECTELQLENHFYKIITEKLNTKTGEYEPYIICKKCITTDYSFGLYSDKDRIYNMCEKYNLYYNDSIVDEVISSGKEYKFGDYLRIISSLRQYQDKKFKNSVFENSNEEQNKESDIDFINDDIIQLKKNIKKALDNYDYNAHNKWMNSLRDALELREKLLSKENKTSINNLNDLKVDYGVFEGRDTNGENVGIIPIFINSHYVRSAYVKYVDEKYEMTDYITDTNK